MSKELTPKEKIQDLIKQLKKSMEETDAAVKAYVQDKEIPLDERWSLFLKSELGVAEDYIVHFAAFNNEKWKQWCRNDLEDSLFECVSKGATFKMVNLDEQLQEMIGEEFTIDGADYESRDNKRTVTFDKEDYDAWREEVLQSFIKSFCFDW